MTNTNDKKTVLHFITGLEAGGGAETMLARVLPHIESTETVVCSMIPKGEMAERLKKEGAEVRSLNMKSKLDIRGIWRYYQLIQDVQPDVQINYLIHADIFGRIFGSVFGIDKIIAFIRNRHEETLFKLAEMTTIRLINCLLTNSPATMRFYRENYTLPDCQNVLPNGVEIPELDSLDASYLYDELPLTKDTNVLTCVARLHKQKDHDTLLNAFAKLLDEHWQTKLLLCGDGPRKKELQRLADQLGIAEKVLFLGRRSDINEILKITDVFVLPSRFEGMSNALLEAMAMARPCVVSDIPENTELITDEKNGLAFTVEDSSDYRRQLQYMLENPDKRKRLGEQAKETVKKQYSVQAERNRFDDFLAKL
jgi:glycosyltransferase involved in cell wall biosynthesis